MSLSRRRVKQFYSSSAPPRYTWVALCTNHQPPPGTKQLPNCLQSYAVRYSVCKLAGSKKHAVTPWRPVLAKRGEKSRQLPDMQRKPAEGGRMGQNGEIWYSSKKKKRLTICIMDFKEPHKDRVDTGIELLSVEAGLAQLSPLFYNTLAPHCFLHSTAPLQKGASYLLTVL